MGFLTCLNPFQGMCCMQFYILSLLVAVIGYYFHKHFLKAKNVSKVNLSYWGPGNEKPDDKTIKPFKICFPQSELEDLRERLNKARKLTPPFEGIGFEYGFNTDYLNSFVEFWKTKYNWTEREAFLNSLPQFKTEIGGLDIHFIHVKPDPVKAEGKEIIPLLLLHGWPGSVREFYGIIPMLTTPKTDANFVFEIVAPSLPGYGFSQGAMKTGLGPCHIGVLFHELMKRLGLPEYYIHGGDWGSIIGNTMAIMYSENIQGYHSTMCEASSVQAILRTAFAYLLPQYFIEESRHKQFKSQFIDTYIIESGYFHIQVTKPDTIGVALTDSPVGLAAYILEKFSTWTNKSWRSLPDGGLENWDKVELLDNVMIYWITNSITTSVRLYSETLSKKYRSSFNHSIPHYVPTAFASFKNDLGYTPKFVADCLYKNIIQYNHFPKGGHFATFEEPKLVSDDLWNFVRTVRSRKN